MPLIFVILLTVVCFILSLPIGGYLARRQVLPHWTLDDEIAWWIKFIKSGGRDL